MRSVLAIIPEAFRALRGRWCYAAACVVIFLLVLAFHQVGEFGLAWMDRGCLRKIDVPVVQIYEGVRSEAIEKSIRAEKKGSFLGIQWGRGILPLFEKYLGEPDELPRAEKLFDEMRLVDLVNSQGENRRLLFESIARHAHCPLSSTGKSLRYWLDVVQCVHVVVLVALFFGLIRAMLLVSRKQEAGVTELFFWFRPRRWGKAVILALLASIISYVAIRFLIIGFGIFFLLFTVVLSLFHFSPWFCCALLMFVVALPFAAFLWSLYLLQDDPRANVLKLIWRSFWMMKGNYFKFMLVFGVLYLIAVPLLWYTKLVAAVWVVPFLFVAQGLFYDWLQADYKKREAEAAARGEEF